MKICRLSRQFPSFSPLFLHEGVGLNGESVSCQKFLRAISGEEWKLVGNSLRETEVSMEGNVDRNLGDRLGNIIPYWGCSSQSALL